MPRRYGVGRVVVAGYMMVVCGLCEKKEIVAKSGLFLLVRVGGRVIEVKSESEKF